MRGKNRGHFIAFIFVFISRVKLREISFHTVYVILEMICLLNCLFKVQVPQKYFDVVNIRIHSIFVDFVICIF